MRATEDDTRLTDTSPTAAAPPSGTPQFSAENKENRSGSSFSATAGGDRDTRPQSGPGTPSVGNGNRPQNSDSSPQTGVRHIPTPQVMMRAIPRTGPVLGIPAGRRGRVPIYDETSAGGLVLARVNGRPCTAVIARRNRLGNIEWCLPKGHVELGETLTQAAVREVSEETGIYGRVIAHLASIDYWFAGPHRRIHKVVHHYLMEAISGVITVENDPDQEAEEAAWVPLDTVAQRLAYPNERRIISIARELLQLGD